MKTIDSLIDFFDRLATPRIAHKFLPRKEITDTQIESIENKLLDLAIEGQEAARRYVDLYRSRMNWEETGSAEHRQDFIDQAHDAQVWLAGNSHSTCRL